MKVELVTSLKRQATKILADLHDTKEPVFILFVMRVERELRKFLLSKQ